MTNQYPWSSNTTPPIASQDDPRYETPGGAANKIEQSLQDSKEYTDERLSLPELPIHNGAIVERHIRDENVSSRTIAQKAVTLNKMADDALSGSNHSYGGQVNANTVTEAIDTLDDRVQYFIDNSGTSVAELLDARLPATGPAFPNVRTRLNNADAQLAEEAQQRQAETATLTVDVGDKSQLTTADKSNLVNAIKEVKAQANANASSIAGIGTLRFIGAYATVEALTSAYPGGTSGVALVTADGYSYYWNGTAWAQAAEFQSTGIAAKSVSQDKTDFLTTGKNLLDISKVTAGFFVDYTTGNLVASAGNKVTDLIVLEPNTTYTLSSQISKDLSQLAFYNSAKTYVSGISNTGTQESITFTTGASVNFMRLTIPITVTDGVQLEKGSSMTGYESFAFRLPHLEVQKSNVGKGAIADQNIDSSSNIVVKKIGKNLLDISKVTLGYYVNYVNGTLVANADNKVTDPIALLPSTTYTLSSQISKDLSQLAFYNNLNQYVSGLPNTGTQESITFTTGSSVDYMRLSIPVAVTDGIQLEVGSAMTSFEKYGYAIKVTDLPKAALYQPSGNTVKVKQDGTGNFTSLRAAIESITDASADNPYTIEIYEGIYDVLTYYTTAEMNTTGFIGLVKPDHVSFKGIGDRAKIIVKCLLPDDELSVTPTRKGQIATLNPYGNGVIENITFTGANLRYVVHDDYNYPNAVLHVKDCDFIRYKGNGTNYGGKQAWGEGSWSGQRRIFENCSFSTEWDYFAYTTHNTAGHTIKSYHRFINCKFFAKLSVYTLRFSSLDGQEEEIELIGTRMNSGILVEPISPYTGDKYKLKGYGNDQVPVKFANTDGVTHTYDFVGETQEMNNSGAVVIPKGSPVVLSSTGVSVIQMVSSMPVTRFYGVAMEEIPANGRGMVRVGGWIPVADTGLTGLAIGDKIGIEAGSLAKVTAGDYIGVVKLTEYIQLL
ncbi:hypothetical protein NYE44_01705 [Paenibacillus sp. FSL L8-0493]|uniref:hypothetical protein n=1 Tax=Paenibacillus sp. FSL L8-0493 TaxID=2975333 RepID=UPI0030FDD6A6